MGLWDSDDDDGGWSSEEEHPSPKKNDVGWFAIEGDDNACNL
jgi:hypothetical protein